MRSAVAGDKIAFGLQWACLALAFYFIASFIFVAVSSMHYPFHLEWMEGQNIDVVQRVASGLPVYTEPTLDYVPFIYTPYYYYVVAFVSLLTGVDFFSGRLVSTLATLGSGALIYGWIRKDGGHWKAALIGAGLFFATYKLSGRWFDVARIDSLFLFLTLAGLFVFYYYRGWSNALCAAALLTAAFFTKQSALLMALPMLVTGIWLDRRHALITSGLFAIMLIAGIAAYNAVSDGWFSFYVFRVPAGHVIDRNLILGFWTNDMFRHFGFIFVLLGLAFVRWISQDPNKVGWYGALALGGIGAAYASRLHMYGWVNVLMPAHAVLALFAGLSFTAFERRGYQALLVANLLVIIQIVSLLYNPIPLFPTQKYVEKGNRFLERIAAIKGDIFMPDLQFVQTRVGKKSYALGMAAYDIFRSDLKEENYVKNRLERQLQEAIRNRQFAAVMPGRIFPLPGMGKYYKFSEQLEYPREFVTGAINFLRTDLFLPTDNTMNPFDKPPFATDDSARHPMEKQQ